MCACKLLISSFHKIYCSSCIAIMMILQLILQIENLKQQLNAQSKLIQKLEARISGLEESNKVDEIDKKVKLAEIMLYTPLWDCALICNNTNIYLSVVVAYCGTSCYCNRNIN